MTAIVLPNLPATGDPSDAYLIMQDFADPAGSSMSDINGHLDRTNFQDLALGPSLTWKDIRPLTQHVRWQTGKTANHDFFRETFAVSEATSLEGPSADLDYKNIPICGLGLRFYLPWDTRFLRIAWMAHWANDARRTSFETDPWAESSQIKLFLDGSAVTATKRGVRLSVNTGDLWPRFPRRGDRVYHGHYLDLNVEKGWHSADIRVISNARQTRIRAGNFRVIGIR